MRHASLFALPLVGLAWSPATAQAPAVINVEMSNFKFEPASLSFLHGQPYVLHLHNAASGGHDFTAADFFAAASVDTADRPMVVEGTVEVPAGQVREIHLTAPAAAGQFKLKCSHSFHKTFGMSGTIFVR